MKQGLERRDIVQEVKLETREGQSTPVIQGYAALFDVETEIGSRYGAFKESVAPGAFKKTIDAGGRVVSLYNHDSNYLLGSTTAGTMKVMEDMRGLWIEVVPPDTQVGRDVVESIRRGDIQGQSFMFVITKEEWTIASEKGQFDHRRILEVDLFEAGPVVFPSYEATSVGLRSETSDAAHQKAREEWEKKNRPEEPIVIKGLYPDVVAARIKALRLK